MNEPQPFDLVGPLPTGVTVLEASAGTGKTYTIAALAARYVASGVPLERMLLVTFGRMATGELRSRVRERLVDVATALALAAHGTAPPPSDEVASLLAQCPADELARRRERLVAAVANFDAATIATTHGFCQQVLVGLGVAGDMEADVAFVDDLTDLVDEVVDDLYLRKFRATGAPDGFTLAVARAIGREALRQPSAVLEPSAAPRDSAPDLRRRLADAVRSEVEVRKRRLRVITYDDLLTRLATTLRDPVRGPIAARDLRRRFGVVMIDEFQDTDPVQWEIVESAFGKGDTTLVLIGDPKQAIYAFRGADVHTYLSAVKSAGSRATLIRNWRSDGDLVTALDAVFGGATLGHPEIVYRTVEAADANRQPRLRGAPHGAAFRLRIAHRNDGRIELTKKGAFANESSARREVARDLASDVVELLSSGAEVLGRGADGTDASAEPVSPGHIAVLVPTHRLGAIVRDELEAVGVPAVISGAGSVFGTPLAKDWAALLEALERPSSVGRVRAAAMSVFIGWSAAKAATADEATWEDVYVRLHEWAATLRDRGVAALLELITHTERLPSRLLGRLDGERELTDLRHIGQLLHQEAVEAGLGVNALAAWLRARIDDAGDEMHDEDRSRRLDSDSEAVQILTVHRCKGLEFPVVYCPYLWHPPYIPTDAFPMYPDHASGGRRTIDVGGTGGPGYAGHLALHTAEVRGEASRLAYVALTRARHQVIVHWATTWASRQSPLAMLLFPDRVLADVAELKQPPSEADVEARLRDLSAAVPGTISVERAGGANGTRWNGPENELRALAASTFDRTVDSSWRRVSYSSVASGRGDAIVSSEADAEGTIDEDLDVAVVVPGADDERERLVATALPLAGMPGGPRIGTMVHAVLEHVDFAAADIDAALRTALEEQSVGGLGVGPVDDIVAGLRSAIETPLGPLAGGLRLRDIDARDRLDELTFELPLVGGDTTVGNLDLAALADVFEAHLAIDDPLAGYPAMLRDDLPPQDLGGYLTGSIDAVLRLPSDDNRPVRYAVVDYKTNWLAVDDTGITAWNYRPAALAMAMQHGHYPLQALFYVVALHRYLRWRVADYDPATHLAGVLYLFLRGMVGVQADDGGMCGVFSWSPPSALVIATSDLLDRGSGGRRG